MTAAGTRGGAAGASAPLVRVEKGSPDPDELAALVVAVLAAARAEPHTTGSRSRPVVWQRLERLAGFCAPHSWQAAAIRPPRPRPASMFVGAGSGQN